MPKSKNLSIFVLAVILWTSSFSAIVSQAEAAVSFSDIYNNWAYGQILSLADRGIVYGYGDGTFKPNNYINRAEFISMNNRAFNFTSTARIYFNDVSPSDWYYQEIAKAVAAGYINGFVDGSMKPNDLITRQEAAVIMARIMDLDTTRTGSLDFRDAAAISSWCRGAIAAMVREGYMSGLPDGTFRPLSPVSRAEAAAMVYKCMTSKVRVSGVILDRSSVTLDVDESVTLKATVQPADADNKSVTWKSSNKNVATVSNTGKVIAQASGTCTITVTTDDGGFTDTCRIRVEEGIPVEGISLKPSTLTIAIGDTIRLEATLDPDDATNQDVTWSSSNTSVAVVDDDGYVTGRRVGTATITVTSDDGDYEDTCRVTVVRTVEVTGVILNPATLTLNIGESSHLNVSIEPENAENQNVTWKSSDPSVATVSSGRVTGIKEGTATITVTTDDGGYEDTCRVTVVKTIPVTGVKISNDTLDLKRGETYDLDAEVQPDDATDQSLTWSSSRTTVATVSSTGLVTARAVGRATITVKTRDGGFSDTCMVNVTL